MLRRCIMSLQSAAPSLQAKLFGLVSQRVLVPAHAARYVVEQTKKGATVPFLARYRRDETGSLDEEVIKKIIDTAEEVFEVHRRREAMLKSLRERGLLTRELQESLMKLVHLSQLEDAWEPFKERKSSLAQRGREAGLEDFVRRLLHTTEFIDVHAELSKVQDGAKLAQAIVTVEVQRCDHVRTIILENFRQHGTVCSSLVASARKKVAKEMDTHEFDQLQKHFEFYDGKTYPLPFISAHTVLALYRAEAKGALKLNFTPGHRARRLFDEWAKATFVRLQHGGGRDDRHTSQLLGSFLDGAYDHVVKAAESTVRRDLKKSAENQAISVFAHNLRQLLLQRPLRGARVLAMDPGLRHGVKCIAIDENGTLLTYFKCFINRQEEMIEYIAKSTQKLNLNKIVIGNGTASRETADIVTKAIEKHKLESEFAIVSEAGASVYSVSDVAKEEFPSLDPMYRGAVSIGRRVLDPLSELVKIPVRSMGIGMYQHDVNERVLLKELHRVVESCVANVGVNAASSNRYVIEKIPGLPKTLVDDIVASRQGGRLNSREDLRRIPRITDAVYQQVAGFFRFPNSPEPLDNTNIHPEAYTVTKKVLERFGSGASGGSERVTAGRAVLHYADKASLAKEIGCGVETLLLVANELVAPALDPRSELPNVGLFRKAPREAKDLKLGEKLTGVVQNVTTFGAFVDCGLHNNILVREIAIDESKPGDVIADLEFVGLDDRGRVRVRRQRPSSARGEASGQLSRASLAAGGHSTLPTLQRGGLRFEWENCVTATVEADAPPLEAVKSAADVEGVPTASPAASTPASASAAERSSDNTTTTAPTASERVELTKAASHPSVRKRQRSPLPSESDEVRKSRCFTRGLFPPPAGAAKEPSIQGSEGASIGPPPLIVGRRSSRSKATIISSDADRLAGDTESWWRRQGRVSATSQTDSAPSAGDTQKLSALPFGGTGCSATGPAPRSQNTDPATKVVSPPPKRLRSATPSGDSVASSLEALAEEPSASKPPVGPGGPSPSPTLGRRRHEEKDPAEGEDWFMM